MKEPQNPFVIGHRISRPYFCDRHDEERRLVEAVANGRNLVMISPRRMGKTSLIHVALRDSPEISARYQTFFFDILQTNSLREFTFLLGRAIYDALKPRGLGALRGFFAALQSVKGSFGFDPLSGVPTFDLQLGDLKNPEYTLEEIFGYVEQSEKPVVIVIDEFQQVTKYPETNAEAILRSHIQRLANATFVFAGSERSILQEMFVSSKRPFYNSAEIMHLDPIPQEQYVEFAQTMFRQRGRELDAEPVRRAFELLDGNTYYLQRTLNGAFAATPEGARCDAATVGQALRAMLAASEVVYRELLAGVSASQKPTLIALARSRTTKAPTSGDFIREHALASASAVQSALKRLTAMGLVGRTPEGYELCDPLLRILVNEIYATSELRILAGS